MTEAEKDSAVKLVKALDVLPDSKKEYILGFADGMIHAQKEDNDERDPGEQGRDNIPG